MYAYLCIYHWVNISTNAYKLQIKSNLKLYAIGHDYIGISKELVTFNDRNNTIYGTR